MKITDILDESKQSKEPPKPRNFVAKNAINTGAGAHKDKKKAEKQGDVKHKKQAIPMDEGLDEMYGRRSSYYNPMDYERDQQRQMDWERRDFKRREMEHELGHEDDPNFERNLRQQQMDRDRGPWYLKIDGKILKVKGEAKVFDWKKGANNYALAILKNRPDLKDKIFLTKRAEDDVAESATPGATSAANVSVGPVYKNKPAKTPKNKDGTAKNALDLKNTNLLTGGSIGKQSFIKR